jgi:hypothetical protein
VTPDLRSSQYRWGTGGRLNWSASTRSIWRYESLYGFHASPTGVARCTLTNLEDRVWSGRAQIAFAILASGQIAPAWRIRRHRALSYQWLSRRVFSRSWLEWITRGLVVKPAERCQAPGLKFGCGCPGASRAIPESGGLSSFSRSRNVPDPISSRPVLLRSVANPVANVL